MRRFLPYSLFSKTLASIHRPGADAFFSPSSYSTAAAAAPERPRPIRDYLVAECGFSPEKAARISAKLGGITSVQQLDCVVGFFKSHGLEGAQMAKLLSWNPRWLFLDLEKSLVPKFQALQGLGFSGADIVRLLGSSPVVLSSTVETLVTKIQFWQGILGYKDFMLSLSRNGQWLLGYSILNMIKPNIEMLRECGIPDEKLAKIVRYHPRIIGQSREDLKALISRVESLGVPRTSGMFHWTLWALCNVTPRKFNAQLESLKGLGWSEDEFLTAFRRTPTFLTSSPQGLQKKYEFLVKEVGCDPSYIKSRPVLLTLSLEKRIIPRCQILAALKSRGLWDESKLTSFFVYTDKNFLKNFVFRHKEEFPKLIGLYKAKVK